MSKWIALAFLLMFGTITAAQMSTEEAMDRLYQKQSTTAPADIDSLQEENERLREEIIDLRGVIADLRRQLGQSPDGENGSVNLDAADQTGLDQAAIRQAITSGQIVVGMTEQQCDLVMKRIERVQHCRVVKRNVSASGAIRTISYTAEFDVVVAGPNRHVQVPTNDRQVSVRRDRSGKAIGAGRTGTNYETVVVPTQVQKTESQHLYTATFEGGFVATVR